MLACARLGANSLDEGWWGAQRPAAAFPITDRESLIRLVTVLYKSPLVSAVRRLTLRGGQTGGLSLFCHSSVRGFLQRREGAPTGTLIAKARVIHQVGLSGDISGSGRGLRWEMKGRGGTCDMEGVRRNRGRQKQTV